MKAINSGTFVQCQNRSDVYRTQHKVTSGLHAFDVISYGDVSIVITDRGMAKTYRACFVLTPRFVGWTLVDGKEIVL